MLDSYPLQEDGQVKNTVALKFDDDTDDCEILHQFIDFIGGFYPTIYRLETTIPGGAGFCNHQQYVPFITFLERVTPNTTNQCSCQRLLPLLPVSHIVNGQVRQNF